MLKGSNKYQEHALEDYKEECGYWENHYQNLVNHAEGCNIFQVLKRENIRWRDFFLKLEGLENEAIGDIPWYLKKDDATMHPLNTLIEDYDFFLIM